MATRKKIPPARNIARGYYAGDPRFDSNSRKSQAAGETRIIQVSGNNGGSSGGNANVDTTVDVYSDGLFVASRDGIDLVAGQNVTLTATDQSAQAKVAVQVDVTLFGTAFPATPVAGSLFLRTDLDYELFFYDGDRSKWLSARTFELTFTSQVAVLAGAYFRPFQGRPCSTTFGMCLPYDMTLVELRAIKDTAIASDFDIYNETTAAVVATLSLGAPTFGSSVGLDVNAAADDRITAKGGTAGVATGGNITAVFRRRAA